MDSGGYARQWLPLEQAAEALGVSVRTLYRLRLAGVLQRGVHWHRNGLGRRAPVQVNVGAARLALQVFCSR